jgi:transcriptional regulator with XRE-family HTH domain
MTLVVRTGMVVASVARGRERTRAVAAELARRVGESIRCYRRGVGISQEALADRLGCHRTYLGGVERGERNLTLGTLERLAESLGVEPLDLLAGGVISDLDGRKPMALYAADPLRLQTGDQFAGVDLEHLGQDQEVDHGDVRLASLDEAHMISVEPGELGEPFLGQLQLFTPFPDALSEHLGDPFPFVRHPSV